MRKAKIIRKTKETSVALELNLDGMKPSGVSTTVPFFDHMLTLMAYHGGLGLSVKAKGDTEVDDHHLVEDTGIALGKALAKALGPKKGIARYGNFLLPMDEALAYVVIDISGRPYLGYKVKFKPQSGGFDFGLLEDFFYALAINAGITVHIELKKGRNNHHMAEAVFKGFGKALAQAVAVSKGRKSVPSTKGRL